MMQKREEEYLTVKLLTKRFTKQAVSRSSYLEGVRETARLSALPDELLSEVVYELN